MHEKLRSQIAALKAEQRQAADIPPFEVKGMTEDGTEVVLFRGWMENGVAKCTNACEAR